MRKRLQSLGYAKILQGKNKKLSRALSGKGSEDPAGFFDELSAMEQAGEKDIDRMSGCFGRIMEEILAWKPDVWENDPETDGLLSGKIYLSSGCL